LEEYYNANSDAELVGCSVSATEHSVACSTIINHVDKIKKEMENVSEEILMKFADVEYVNNLINNVYPKGIVSIVADSFDYWNTITNTAKVLKDDIMKRDGKVVFRPDTGDPVEVVCGIDIVDLTNEKYVKDLEEAKMFFRDIIEDRVRNKTPHGEIGDDKVVDYFKYQDTVYEMCVEFEWNRHDKQYYYINGAIIKYYRPADLTSEQKGSIECLWEIFGGTTSDQGYKVLDPHVGLIYGDSITLERAQQICQKLMNKGFASTNIVFGIGSFTYQYVTRDTDCYAIKATYAEVDNKKINIYKKPKTGDGMKNSALGLVAVLKDENEELYLKDQVTWEEVKNCEFQEVFNNGSLLVDCSLSEIRERINQQL